MHVRNKHVYLRFRAWGFPSKLDYCIANAVTTTPTNVMLRFTLQALKHWVRGKNDLRIECISSLYQMLFTGHSARGNEPHSQPFPPWHIRNPMDYISRKGHRQMKPFHYCPPIQELLSSITCCFHTQIQNLLGTLRAPTLSSQYNRQNDRTRTSHSCA